MAHKMTFITRPLKMEGGGKVGCFWLSREKTKLTVTTWPRVVSIPHGEFFSFSFQAFLFSPQSWSSAFCWRWGWSWGKRTSSRRRTAGSRRSSSPSSTSRSSNYRLANLLSFNDLMHDAECHVIIATSTKLSLLLHHELLSLTNTAFRELIILFYLD